MGDRKHRQYVEVSKGCSTLGNFYTLAAQVATRENCLKVSFTQKSCNVALVKQRTLYFFFLVAHRGGDAEKTFDSFFSCCW